MTSIDNGYGARTTISYRSAKEDSTTRHDVPFPEIVVSAIETKGMRNLGGRLQEVRYAFGNAEMYFDSQMDAFTIRAYGRSVAVYGTGSTPENAALAVITDTNKLTPFDPQSNENQRRLRYLRWGRPSASYTLANNVPRDPWGMLSLNALGDPRLIGSQSAEWDSKQIQTIPYFGEREDCADVMYPYNWQVSWNTNHANGTTSCIARSLSYAKSSTAWAGTAPPLTNFNNLESRTDVLAIDDLGRPTSVRDYKDTSRSDDDVCIELTYALATTDLRVDAALATRKLTDCRLDADAGRTLSFESFEYDELPVGQVGVGNLTSRRVERRATYDGQLLGTIIEFAASYDARGNATYVASARAGDGAIRATTVTYDDFALVPIQASVNATGVPAISTKIERDPLTLGVVGGKDPNGMSWHRVTDAYGREVSVDVTPPTNPAGVKGGLVSTTSYSGFEAGATSGRVVTTTVYSDPIPTGGSGVGRTSTVFLDELGRSTRIEQALGTSYVDAALIVVRTYDDLGRLHFESDPYPTSQEGTAVYGTTYHFGQDGQMLCSIRGNGEQPLTTTSNLAQEVFPTCTARTYGSHQLTVTVTAPDATVPNTPQTGVVHRETITAAGRVIQQETLKIPARLELSSYRYDRLGQLIELTRYQDPGAASQPTTFETRFDSLGQVLTTKEPSVALRSFTYSSFGELQLTDWTDTSSGSSVAKQLGNAYDGLGRLTQSYEKDNGTTIPETVYDYVYDKDDSTAPVPSDYPLGRLTATKSALGNTYVSYDPFGHVDQRAFIVAGKKYYERTFARFDGVPYRIEHALPDNNWATEKYEYHYDSAGRLRDIYDGVKGATVYEIKKVDPFGRVLEARYGWTQAIKTYADYAKTGRRLPISSDIVSATSAKRNTSVTSYDAVGRELSRTESGLKSYTITRTFDALGRLGSELVDSPGSNTVFQAFTYDALGNLRELTNSEGGSAYLTYDSLDKDRTCRVSYGAPSPGSCNVTHDAMGNVTEMPTRSLTRKLTYFPGGDVRTIVQDKVSASFTFDASGAISKLVVGGTAPKDPRQDVRVGPFTQRKLPSGDVTFREIPGVGSRRGKNGPIVFPFEDERGLRFAADSTKNDFVQDVRYLPFGEASSDGANIGSTTYSSEQWNGGDLLADFGINWLGARMYDPVIGRFLSRDPLLIPRSAAMTNPYAFAFNDPVNTSDPSGLDPWVNGSWAGGVCLTSSGGACGGIGAAGGGYGGALLGLAGLAWNALSGLLGGGGGAGEARPASTPAPTSSVGYWNPATWAQGMAFYGCYGVACASVVSASERSTWMYRYSDGFQHGMWDGIKMAALISVTPMVINAKNVASAAWGIASHPHETIDLITATASRAIYDPYALGEIHGSFAGTTSFGLITGAAADQIDSLLARCAGGSCPCFVAGTLIDNETTGSKIESTNLGDRVGPELEACQSAELADWREIDLVMLAADGGAVDTFDIKLLRSEAWIRQHGAVEGRTIQVALDDLNVEGPARVSHVGNAGLIRSGTRCPVTGWIHHLSASVIPVTMEGGSTLLVTRHHRLFSITKKDWVHAGDLEPGDTLQTKDGTVKVRSVGQTALPITDVFNLEVFGAHSYFVGQHRVLAHNSYASSPIPKSYMNLDHVVDMEEARGIPGSSTNRYGEVRNRNFFWRQLYQRFPQMFSKGNVWRIFSGDKAPRVDSIWAQYNPTHQSFMGEILDHHHITHSRYAVPLPQTVHQQWTSALHE